MAGIDTRVAVVHALKALSEAKGSAIQKLCPKGRGEKRRECKEVGLADIDGRTLHSVVFLQV
ncbi:hypothetical protein RRF57_010820 [Xylaria bambusicola]|uniref:Uncharacterized protein n=1 Tax=Xylaria bambusicola TaxID=326684 RepID=A0AAN7ZDG8_9PEZI